MDGIYVEGLGLVAGCMTTGSLIPQLLRAYRSRSVKDISLRMYLMLSTGIFLWMVYGILIGSISVIAANLVSLGLSLAILTMKLRFGKNPAKTVGDKIL